MPEERNGGDFYWQVRLINRKTTYVDDIPTVEEHPYDVLVRNVEMSTNGVRWKRNAEMGKEDTYVAGETMFIPWWRVVSIARHHADEAPDAPE